MTDVTRQPNPDVDVLVVGAGVAGLSAAAELQRRGRRVLVLDKGRGLGGRLPSRRIGGATFDHGAQFVTARTPRFAAKTDAFSRGHWDNDRQEAGRRLLDAAQEWLGAGILEFQVHGWRYSKPARVHEAACVVVSRDPLLVLAGDAFAGPRVEGAAVSGWAAAEAVLEGVA